MKSGPLISMQRRPLDGLDRPQKWPLPSPRSRNQRPPGHGFDDHRQRFAVRRFVRRAHLLEQRAKVASSEARTWISCVTLRVRLSSDGAVMSHDLFSFDGSSLGALLDAHQLMTPVAFERSRPFVQRTDGLGVGAIEASAVRPAAR